MFAEYSQQNRNKRVEKFEFKMRETRKFESDFDPQRMFENARGHVAMVCDRRR